jgi:hypothetical protein
MKKPLSLFIASVYLTTPFLTFAQSPEPTLFSASSTPSFCSSLDSTFAYIDKNKALTLSKNPSLQKITTKKPVILIGNVDAKRVEITALRRSISTELQKRASKPEDKVALDTFLKKIEFASLTKDTAINEIINQANELSNESLTVTKAQIAKATSTFEKSLRSAKIDAQNDCQNGKNDEATRQSFKKNIEEANKTLRETLTLLETKQNKISTSKNDLRKQVEQIMQDYRTTVESAKTELRTSLATKHTTQTATTSVRK